MVTICTDCPFSSENGWYVWCPRCGSGEVKYE